MAGRVKKMIDTIISERSRGNPAIAKAIETKFILKGINPSDYSAASPDDPAVIQTLRAMAEQFGISV